MSTPMLNQQISNELSLPLKGVTAVLLLLTEGSTVPFIARYRKEVTGGLNEVQIRDIEERRMYRLDLESRRATILKSIEQQGKLTLQLRAAIEKADTKSILEDLYLPFKKKRRTRGQIARERGLEGLAKLIREQPSNQAPDSAARQYIGTEVPNTEAALKGARDIIAEEISENADIRSFARRQYTEKGVFSCSKARNAKEVPSKFEQYYDFQEPVKSIPSHRFLAIRRGEKESFLKAKILIDETKLFGHIKRKMEVSPQSPLAQQLTEAVEDSCKRLLGPSVESEVRVDLKTKSDLDAIEVFGVNLRNLLLASPLGNQAVIGIDPGLRTGCKCVALSTTGKYLGTTTINLVRGDPERAKQDLLSLLAKHPSQAIAVGNGTGGRETESFVRALCKEKNLKQITIVQVNESGASIYSASDIARKEFPDLDLTLRGAISIARRLQDPLAELVKLDPKVIGVGQYQHDVNQPLLQRKLGQVIESCVNHVGVNLNTASASLLGYVAGIGTRLAESIVSHREKKGVFTSRTELLKVAGLGPKAFQQAGGFLRIQSSSNALDSSAVHPERYSVVGQMATDLGVNVQDLVGNDNLAKSIKLSTYVDGELGLPTLKDIVEELTKPGRDPRKVFEAPKFREDVKEMSDLQIGMKLEGVVTNVTAFGAFIDIGVHQDGLVHVSQLSDHFVKDPAEVVQVGDNLKVFVLEVDIPRKRISLSAKTQAESKPAVKKEQTAPKTTSHPPPHSRRNKPTPKKMQKKNVAFTNNPFAGLKK